MNRVVEASPAQLATSYSGEKSPNVQVVGAAILLSIAGTLYLLETVHRRQAALYLVGIILGIVLYHAAFGFTTAWREFLLDGRGAGLRAHMLLLALTSILFLPALAAGSLFGQPVAGAVAPVGIAVLVGAFLFGIGMQLGGG